EGCTGPTSRDHLRIDPSKSRQGPSAAPAGEGRRQPRDRFPPAPRPGRAHGRDPRRAAQEGSAVVDFEFTEEQRMLRDSVRKMMAKFAAPEYVRRLDREQAFPDELYAEWLNMGLFRMPFPEEYGGLGGNVIDMVIIAEELSY